MKRSLIIAAALLLTLGLPFAGTTAGAEEAVTNTAPEDALFVAADTATAGCTLPDLAGMSQEEIEEAALEGGFDVAPVNTAVQACPVRFNCSSITNCAAGPLCSITDIGPCCSQGGLQLCCISGTIKVRRCPCECTAFACSLSCVNNDQVRWGCS